MRMKAYTYGFSLIELSIVLVILGLLTGGILTGQSLIRAAELRSVVTGFEKIETATMIFQEKYFALPGDMNNATAFWPAADAGDGLGNDCQDATSTNKSTCNGNGNGWIEGASPPYVPTSAENGSEWFHAYVQLANAGLIEGQYTGLRAAGLREARPGINVLAGKLNGTGFTLMSVQLGSANPEWYSGLYNPMIIFGGVRTDFETGGVALRASETWGIDKKMDDTKPGTGRIRSYADNNQCVTATGDINKNTAQYNLSSSDIACVVIYSLSDPH